MAVWTALATAARDLLLAETCACCPAAVAPGPVCPRCQADIDAMAGTGARRVRPLQPPQGFPRTLAAADYSGPVRRLLLAHKERATTAAARPLGRLLATAVAAAAQPAGSSCPLVLVPIPSSPAITRRRGHDPVRRMALVTSRVPGLDRPVRVAAVLAQARRVVDQSGLSLQQRQANLQHGLTVTRRQWPPSDAWVVLVDDVCSSGATLAAAAAALRAAGTEPARVTAAVVAAPVLLRSRDRWPVPGTDRTD